MKIINTLKSKAKNLKKDITALYYAYQNPDLGALPKIMAIVTIAYMLSPVDLIPDFIPVLGYLDDLIIIPALIALSIRLIPEDIMKEARIKAEENPFTLKKNYIAAAVVILVWMVVLIAVIRVVISFIK